MDELLTFMEEDLEYDDDPEDDPRVPDPSCKRITASPLKSRNESQEKELQKLTFKDVFGSPDKRDVKEFGLSNKSNPSKMLDFGVSSSQSQRSSQASSLSSTSSSIRSSSQSSDGNSQQFALQRAIRHDSKVPYKPDSSLVVIDPYSRVRILKSTISIFFDETVTAETVLKERNIGMEFVSLMSFGTWYRGKGKDTKNFWVSGVLTRKTSGVRKSANGNDYSIWEINDLKELDKKLTVFLFGAASGSSAVTGIPVGSLVDLTSPSVMQDSSEGVKFSVNNATQVRFIATAKDYGICQGKKKDGNKCTAVVNTWECSFCIYHASAELKKMNIGKGKGGKGKGKNGYVPNKSFSGGESQTSLNQQGITIANFGRSPTAPISGNQTFGGITTGGTGNTKIVTSRMSLQGVSNEMKKNPIKYGNPETVTFMRDGANHPLLKNDPAPAPAPRKPLDLNPLKTRHLTDKDRDLLKLLGTSKPDTPAEKVAEPQKGKKKIAPTQSPAISEFIASQIVSNPNAAGRNFMQYLTLQNAPKDQVDLASSHKTSIIQPLTMTRAKVRSMEKALAFVKKNGPLARADPNAVSSKKRKLTDSDSPPSSQPGPSNKKRSSATQKIDVEFEFDSDDFKKILNAKSAHDDELDQIQHEEYFGKLEKKEALENKLLSTYSIETTAVLCRQCKYVALSQSDFCKEQMHQVRLVKARKRFFKCKDCGNRTMSLDRLPKRPCSNCNSSSWLVAPVGKERKGPTLPSEMLAVRGNEEKFIGAAGSKMFMHLEV